MSSATSNHACIYCKIHTKDRWDVSKPEDFYSRYTEVRKLEDLKNCAPKSILGCKQQPLICLPLDHVVVDELHLMLRVTDRLLENLIQDAVDCDAKEQIGAAAKALANGQSHLNGLRHAIQYCGVTFKMWETKDKNGKGTGNGEFSSLVGAEKKKLLLNLPESLQNRNVLHQNTQDTVVKIWKRFAEVYFALSSHYKAADSVPDLFSLARDWVKLFLSLEGKRKGYERKRVTPYMHIMVYHVPALSKKYLGIRKFSAQGMEKLNDIVKSIHHQHSNKIEACADVVRASWRQSQLSDRKRSPRVYSKQKPEYWKHEIFKKRQKTSHSLGVNQVESGTGNPIRQNER